VLLIKRVYKTRARNVENPLTLAREKLGAAL